jgi:uncharacterized repeat protein (TIGR01451 family)
LAGVLVANPPPVSAAENRATGGIGGINNGTLLYGDGTGEARISLTAVDLALVKQARDLTGAVLPGGATVSPGQEIWFVLHVDNPTTVPASDVRFTDLLDEAAFTYVPGTLQKTTVPTGSTNPAIWAGVWSALTDAVGAPDDQGSVTDTSGPPGPDRITVGAAPLQTNTALSLPPSSLVAIRFRVRVN